MRTTVALRTLAAALLTGGTLAVAVPAAVAGAHADVAAPVGPVLAVVVSHDPAPVRAAPTGYSALVNRLWPGTHVSLACETEGQTVHGSRIWFQLSGDRGWVSAHYVDAGHRWVPACGDTTYSVTSTPPSTSG
ncbi:SH3 domain-containing protein [Streptomyces sp. NPDC054794]